MRSFFDDFKGWSDEKIYQHFVKLFYHNTVKNPNLPYSQSHQGVTNDYWNAYDYGKEIKIVYFKKGIINQKPKKLKGYKAGKDASKEGDEKRFAASISRSRSRVFELAMCNEFRYFCTFTQDEKIRDRFDLTNFRKDFAQYVRNLNRFRDEKNKIKYLLIPEEHAKGGWHMHGLLQGLTDEDLRLFTLKEKLPTSIRNALKQGKKIYDWQGYRQRFGYFTCSPIGDGVACAKYITKYITKDLQKSVRQAGEHLFFASQGLNGKKTIVLHSFDECPIFEDWDYENEYIKIKTIKMS